MKLTQELKIQIIQAIESLEITHFAQMGIQTKDIIIKYPADKSHGDFATNIASGRFHAPLIKDSAYEIPYGNTLKMMDEHVDSGSNPNEMADAIYKIIETKEPKIHYKVGVFMQKFSIVLKRVLPDKVYEKMLMNHYKL